MAKLPSTIYNEILKRQKELFKDGTRNGSISIEEAQSIFAAAGYKTSTANKWLLNWAVSRVLRFEKEKEYYCIRLGDFTYMTPSECLDNGRVWLPVKECRVKIRDDNRAQMKDPVKTQGMIL